MRARWFASAPTPTVAKAPPAPWAELTRSSQPVRTLEPGAARSISSMAWKCDRVGAGWPAACTTPKVPASQNGFRGDRAGCSPKVASSGSSRPDGMPMPGRAAA